MMRSHNRKSYPADKMLPRRTIWLTPNPNLPWPAYGDLLRRPTRHARGNRYFEERLGSRGNGVRQVVKRLHTRKSRQWSRKLERDQECVEYLKP